MGIKQLITATCDRCGQTIADGELYVDASYFGKITHIQCITDMTTIQLCKFLGIDTIYIRQLNGDNDLNERIYTKEGQRLSDTRVVET